MKPKHYSYLGFRFCRYAAASAFLVAPLAPCQSTQPLPATPLSASASTGAAPIDFESVRIRQNKEATGPMSHSFPSNGDEMTFTNTPMFMIILFAYDFKRPEMVTGLPQWTTTERYDVEVKVDPENVDVYHGLSLPQRRKMLQRVLERQLNLAATITQIDTPSYALTVDNKGLKMQDDQHNDHMQDIIEHAHKKQGQSVYISAPGELTGIHAHMKDLALALSDMNADRPIVDETNLSGTFTFTIKFAFNSMSAQSPGTDADRDGQSSGNDNPSIFTALKEQLGLKLVPGHHPVEHFVINRIEKPGSDN